MIYSIFALIAFIEKVDDYILMIYFKKSIAFYSSVGFLCFAVFVCCNPLQAQSPNILYIMADDHATEAIGIYKGRLALLNPTPNIDALARNGMVFSNAYSTNPICTPARANILTGQYSHVNNVRILLDSLPVANQFLPSEIKKLGYQTSIIGKWHLESEPGAFDHYEVLIKQGTYFDPLLLTKGKGKYPKNQVNYKGHSTDIITDRAINWLENRDRNKPFMFMLHYKAPHDDFEFAPRYKNYLEDSTIPEPPTLYNRDGFGSVATRGVNNNLDSLIGSSVSSRNHFRNYVKQYGFDTATNDLKEQTHLAYQEYLKRYLRCVKGIDNNLKRVFDYLKANGLWENTIIIYTSDQGFMLGEHDYIDKRWMYQPSMQIPFIVHYPPSVKPGSISDLIINSTDVAPTLLEIAGGKRPEYMQGLSFASLLHKNEKPKIWREATYCRYWMHMEHHFNPSYFGIRNDSFKLIFYYGLPYDTAKLGKSAMGWAKNSPNIDPTMPAWEFYDLAKDPDETTNQYTNPKYRSIIEDMKIALAAEREHLLDTDKAYPKIGKVINENWAYKE